MPNNGKKRGKTLQKLYKNFTEVAKLRIVQDSRCGKDGRSAIKISVSAKGSTVYIPLGINVPPECWDPEETKVIDCANCELLNRKIKKKYLQMELFLMELENSSDIGDFDAKRLRDILVGHPAEGSEDSGCLFERRFILFKDSHTNDGTRGLYQTTLNRMRDFDPFLSRRTFDDINKKWLTDFDRFLSLTAKSANARAIHFRNIRSVFNDAIDDEAIQVYPFRKFKIKYEETRKRSLSVDELRELMEYPCEDYQIRYRDMFMLMFFLIGVNAVDLFNARKNAIVKGRFEYRRAKTGKLYSVKLEPEAIELIERYSGDKYVLNIMDECKYYKNFLHEMGNGLKNIGMTERRGRGGKKIRESLFPDISSYWARHTWATIAAELDIPKETIAEALGHSIGNPTTSIYIKFNQNKVDNANRRVIDYVLYGNK